MRKEALMIIFRRLIRIQKRLGGTSWKACSRPFWGCAEETEKRADGGDGEKGGEKSFSPFVLVFL